MEPTNTAHPDYYHKVVDCQWACPAHTDVPEYIRLIAQGRFTDAYMVNRHSNVFPGILGRVCDRPCEPACRRTRVEEQPVAICRLKRVAADHRDDITGRLPKIPQLKNGKRVALIGAGCASLTVANDLMPLGYEVTIFEQSTEPGGLMRTNIPSFRLPHAVLNDERPSTSAIGALPLGTRASKSSCTRGRPVVMSSPATPPVWKVRMVSCVPGSPIDWAATMPTASPTSTSLPVASERP